MTAPSDLEALLARVEGATGGDREVDAAICKAVDTKRWEQARHWAAMPCGAPEETIERDAARYAFAYTASLDAALALVERVLPTFTVDLTIYRTNGGDFRPHALARLFCPYGEISEYRGDAATAALALIQAALKALSAQSASPAGRSDRATVEPARPGEGGPALTGDEHNSGGSDE